MPGSKTPSGLAESLTPAESTAPEDPPVPSYPDPYIVEPTSPHTHTAILLHGLGSNGRDFGNLFLTASVMSNDKDSPFSRTLNGLYPAMKWVFPSASLRRSTRFNRVKLFSWFDIFSIQDPSQREETQIEGLVQSSRYLRGLIAEEIKQLENVMGGEKGAEKKVVFGGLSQGCAISLATLLSLDVRLGGWVGMSGFMPLRGVFKEALRAEVEDTDDGIVFQDDASELEVFPKKKSDGKGSAPETEALNAFRQHILSLLALSSTGPAEVLQTPVFYGHGSDDEKVAPKLGDELVETIRALNMKVENQVYPGLGHWFQAPEEIDDMISFFTKHGAWPDHADGRMLS